MQEDFFFSTWYFKQAESSSTLLAWSFLSHFLFLQILRSAAASAYWSYWFALNSLTVALPSHTMLKHDVTISKQWKWRRYFFHGDQAAPLLSWQLDPGDFYSSEWSINERTEFLICVMNIHNVQIQPLGTHSIIIWKCIHPTAIKNVTRVRGKWDEKVICIN